MVITESSFTLGEQYDNYEFDLYFEEIKKENNLEYLIYRYKKDERHYLFNIEITGGIFLAFNGDILNGIYFHFYAKNYTDLLTSLNFKKNKLNMIKSNNKVILFLI